jgi:hypothetical protein
MSPISSTLANASAYGYRTLAAAAAGAYESIATVIPSGSTNTVTFSSIPSSYASLQLRILARGTANGSSTDPLILFMRANGDTGTNYANHRLFTDGTVQAGGSASAQTRMTPAIYADSGYPANVFGVIIIDIHDYASTTRNKTVRTISGVETNAGTTANRLDIRSDLWMNTSAIDSLTIQNNGADNFSSSSSFALYGIKGA